MRQPPAVISCATLMSALALAGCGGSSGGSNTPAQTVKLKSAAIVGHTIPALYTCDGKDIHPPLEWGAVPSNTKELVLLAVGFVPSASGEGYNASMEWALAGVKPGLHRLAAGRTPPGAHLGVSSDGKRRYSICPKKGVKENYQFMLYAVPASVRVSPSFVGMEALAALSKPGTQTSATGVGAFVAAYKRM